MLKTGEANIGANIKTEMAAGKPYKQALAIALSQSRKADGSLTAAQRRKIPRSQFAVPSNAPGPGSYPITDKGHAKAALGLLHNAPAALQAHIKAMALKKLK